MHRRSFWACALLAGTNLVATPASAARVLETVYFTDSHGSSNTYLAEWTSTSKARVVTAAGSSTGKLVIAGAERTVTLDNPIVSEGSTGPDSCGNNYQVRYSIEKVLFRQLTGNLSAGQSEIIDIGQATALTGCDAGTITPFGSPGSSGLPQTNLATSSRPSLSDLLPGVRLAGMQEARMVAGVPFPAQQIGVFEAGGLFRFEDTGHVVPAAINANGWLVLNFGGFQTGYTRLQRDTATMAETWLQADFVGGVPVLVSERLFVKPRDPAGFGSKRETARRWESGFFIGMNNPLYFDLYGDFTGTRISVTLDPPTEVRLPITWAFVGPHVTTSRAIAGGAQRVRTWVPIANKGVYRWVIESEVTRNADGSELPFIVPRVNFYIDLGPAVKPAAAASFTSAPREPGRVQGLQP